MNRRREVIDYGKEYEYYHLDCPDDIPIINAYIITKLTRWYTRMKRGIHFYVDQLAAFWVLLSFMGIAKTYPMASREGPKKEPQEQEAGS